MIDLGSMTDKFSESGQKVVRRAIELSKSRDHNFIGVMHLFMALVEVDAHFAETMREVGIDSNSVTRLLEEELAKTPVQAWPKMAIPEPTRDLFNRALRRARAQGRQQIGSYDLFVTLFTDQTAAPTEILRRLGADPEMVIMASDTLSQRVRMREKQLEWLRNRVKSGDAQPFNFSRLTADFLNSIVTIEEKSQRPDLWWESPDVSLTIQEQQQVKAIVFSIIKKSLLRMNEATIWSRAIYPLLVLAEQGGLEAWAKAPLKAGYTWFGLEGVVDGAVVHNISGRTKSFCLIVVQIKREPVLQNPKDKLYGAMLAAARLNWERNNQVPQEIFGCYTIDDNWTFNHGMVFDLADHPKMTVASSRLYSEKVEAETILRILKSITGKYAQNLTGSA